MNNVSQLDINTLRWVKSEIDATLDQARVALETYVESPDDESQLRFCVNYLHQVHGTLQMVELYGAALVAEELERLTQALLDGKIANKEDSYESVMRGMLQLPDYLERLMSDSTRDMPLVLLPLLNDLRAARGEALLTENALFQPDLSVSAPAVLGEETSSVQQLARKMRHTYHLGLLGWFRDTDRDGSLGKLAKVINKLRDAANDPEASRMLWVASGVVEGLRDGGLESSVAVKLLMGNVDRQIKRIIDKGEQILTESPPSELVKNLLYYISRSESHGDRVTELKGAFSLADLLPDDQSLEKARADLTGPNAELMQTVASVLVDDLTKVKDNLDVFMRAQERDVEALRPLAESLRQMADTLGMLGLGIQRKVVSDQAGMLSDMLDGECEVDGAVLMDMAGALLSVETSLSDLSSARAANEDVGEEDSESIEARLKDVEQRKLLKQVIAEANVDLNKVKDALNDYSRSPDDRSLLTDIPATVSRIQGSISILGLERAAQLLGASSRYVEQALLNSSAEVEDASLDLLADAISSVEYYLESLAEDWGNPETILDVAEQSLIQLGVMSLDSAPDGAPTASAVEPAPQDDYGDDTVVDLPQPEASLTDAFGPVDAAGVDQDTLVDIASPEIGAMAETSAAESGTLELEIPEPSGDALSLEGIDGATGVAEIELTPVADADSMSAEIVPFATGVAETEPAAVVPDAPPATTPQSTAPVMEEIDDEIVEIFLEEAAEEHESIARLYPAWKANPADEDSLIEIRRSFHTLKGSGRLVGAVDVGEFAWACESMLNRVLDHTVEAGPVMFELMERAHAVLPQLFELFRTGGRPPQEVFALMEAAHALSQGKEVTLPAAVAEVQAAGEVVSDATGEAVLEMPVEEPNDLVLQSVEELPEDVILELAEEPTVVDELPHEASSGVEVEAHVPPQLGDAYMPEIDPALREIYATETAGHLDTVREFIDNWRALGQRDVTHELVRAVHTLHGSARTTGIDRIAALSAVCEKYTKQLELHSTPVDEQGMELLADYADYVAQVAALVDEPGAGLPDHGELLGRAEAALEAASHMTDEPAVAQVPTPVDEAPVEQVLTPVEEMPVEQVPTSFDEAPVEDAFASFEGLAEPVEEAPVLEYDEELLGIFLEEGTEILDESDRTLNEWRSDSDNREYLEALQRQLHTLKGGARMAGVAAIGDLSHSIETMLTAVVDGQLAPSDEMFELLQRAHDRLVHMLEQVQQHQGVAGDDELIASIDALAHGQAAEQSVGATDAEPAFENVPLHETGVEEPVAEAPVVDELPGIAEDVAPAGLDASGGFEAHEMPPVPAETEEPQALVFDSAVFDVAPTDSTTAPQAPAEPFQAPQESAGTEAAPEEPGFAPAARAPSAAEQVRVRSDLLDDLVNFAGEVSIYRSRMEQQVNSFRYNLQEFDDTVTRLREQLRKFEIEAEAQIQYRYSEETGRSHDDFDPLEFDRFTQMQQLSRGMMESLGDLDSLRGILSNLTRESETLLLQQARVNTELQEGLMRTRMVPFTNQVARLRRIVRQTCRELNKEAELHIIGADSAELDRTVLERIVAPIEHMLRNSIAHGIETSEARRQQGKPEKGRLEIGLHREGSDLVITVSDDGAGINLEAVRARGVEKGIISPDADVSKKALLDMIMESGFSTAEEVTQIAGRGVGMDVVSSEIKQLGGVLEIDTGTGKGARFTVQLPMTLSVSRALMVLVGEESFALPLLSVEGVERVSSEELEQLHGLEKPVYKWLGENYDFMHLGTALGTDAMALPTEGRKVPLLLVRSGDYRAAIQVDGILGSREIVVKPVGPQLSTLRGIAGATIMGDGSVVLILDLGVLIRLTGTQEAKEAAAAAPPAVAEPTPARAPVVMVVDDSITVRKVTTRLLERHDMQVVTAKDGVDALAQLQEIHPDIMLLDVEMPRMDGFELATNIRNDETLKKLPIIMITSRTGQKHRDRAESIGVNIYMGKPYQETELMENINSLIGS
ncbi:MAG: Hpt domain-containing protein [Pseudomonadota bacterium]|nr:MAG: Hpt domain-containing protein [Pseudomonadota bacterium]